MFSIRVLQAAIAAFSLVAALGGVSSAQTPSASPHVTAPFAVGTVFPGTTTVGKASAALSVSVQIATDGTAVAPTATTQGAAISEFTVTPGSTCAAGQVTAGQTCTVNVAFQPQYPGLRRGAVQVTNSTGQVLGSALVAGTGKGSLSVLRSGVINTVIGDGEWVFRGDGGTATGTAIFLPMGIVEDAAGNMYFADSSNNRVRRVDATTHLVSTVAGNGQPGFNGNGIQATNASLNSPADLVLDGADNIYFVDNGNNCVRRVDSVSGIITAVAGTCGVEGFSGDGAAATSATMSLPHGLAMDAAGDLYVSDMGNGVVRRIDAVTGIITTFAGIANSEQYSGDGGPATKAQLRGPMGLTFGLDGSLYIADSLNERIRKVAPNGTITTVAGEGDVGFAGDGGPALQAFLNTPVAVALDPAGNIYIGDTSNNRVREVSITTGLINTIAGGNGESLTGDGSSALSSNLYGPYGLFFDHQGNLLISDMFHNRVRSISATSLPLTFNTIRVSKTSAPQAVGLENDGNADQAISSLALNNAALDPATTNCAAGVLAQGTLCNLGVEFAPTVVGDNVSGTLKVQSDAGNAPNVITLQGQVLTVNPTTVALTSSLNPSLQGGSVTFTATVASTDTTIAGTVDFLDGTSTLCHAVALSGKSATCTTSTLTVGTHSITASYTGDSDNAASVSPAVAQVVKLPSAVALTAAPNPAVVTASVQFTATVTAPSGTPTGTVTFLDNGTAIASAVLVQGKATASTTQLTAGTHTLTATYAGDTNNAAGQSANVSETINVASTVTTLATSTATAPVGTALTFTANVSSTITTQPTGSVQFSDGTTVLGSGVLNNGVATFTTASLAPGSHHIVASYQGDTMSDVSASLALVQTVQQIGTVTLVAADLNPSNAGATVTFTATVSMTAGAVADGPLTGTVTFSDGATQLGIATLDASGKATLQTNHLSVATHSIVASFGGNTNYAASTSSTLSEVVHSTATTTTLSGNGTGLAGKTLTLSATVTSTSGTPTGTVTFMDGTANLGSAQLNAQGSATVTVTTLAVGSHNLTAIYGGDANYVTSTSVALPQTISLATTSLALVGPASPLNAGLQANFTASLTSNGVAPTGALTLFDGTTSIAAQTVNNAGSYTFSTSSLAVGPHTLTAKYAGDADNAAAASNLVSLVIQQGSSATALQSSKSPQVVGQAVTLTAAVTSPSPNLTGNVSFFDGTTLLGSVAVSSTGTATYTSTTLTFGVHSITAVYSGDVNHAASTSSAINQRMVQSVQLGLSSSANPATVGSNLTFTLKASGNAAAVPTGAVTFLDGSSLIGAGTLDATGTAMLSIANLAVGSHNITVAYAGDDNYSATTSSALTQSVINANTQIVLTASSNPATFGSPLIFKAAITSNGGLPTGTVTFTDGAATVGTGLLDANGTATLVISTLAPGQHVITANYAGDGKASASVSAPLTVTVRQLTTLSLASNANPAATLSQVVFTAAVANSAQDVPTGMVNFVDGSSQIGTAQVDASGVATLVLPQLSAGSHSIVATYAGNGTNFGSTSPALTQTVQLRSTTTALTATTNPTNDQQVTLIAVERFTGPAVPTGTVKFMDGSAVLGTVPVDSTGVATLVITVQANPYTVVATYSGDASYAGSNSPATTIGSEAAPQFTMQVNPSTVSLQTKQHSTVTLTINSPNNFADNLEFGCLGLPYAATCTFSKTTAQLNAGGSVQVQLTIDTGNPLGAGASTTAANRTNSTVLFAWLPGSLLAGFALFRSRRKMKLGALMVVVLGLGMTLTSTGCGSIQVNSTPAGNYTFQVTARGQNTGVAESQTITLNVSN